MISSMFVTILSRLGVKQRQIFLYQKVYDPCSNSNVAFEINNVYRAINKGHKSLRTMLCNSQTNTIVVQQKSSKTADKTRSSLRRCVLMLRLPLKVLKYSISQKNEGSNEELKNHTGKMVWHCFNVNLRGVVVIIGHKDGGGGVVSAQY